MKIHSDEQIALRILAYARRFAPCLDTLPPGPAQDQAYAILAAAATELATRARTLKKKAVGDWSWEYLSDDEMGSIFTADDRSALTSMCGLDQIPGGPIGSFPRPHRGFRNLWGD